MLSLPRMLGSAGASLRNRCETGLRDGSAGFRIDTADQEPDNVQLYVADLPESPLEMSQRRHRRPGRHRFG
jgi:hypothetical protein